MGRKLLYAVGCVVAAFAALGAVAASLLLEGFSCASNWLEAALDSLASDEYDT